MRRWIPVLLIAAAAGTAGAQTAGATLPLSIYADPPKPLKFKLDLFTLHLQIAMPLIREPLPGSVPANTSTIPTAFALNHVSFPYRPGWKSVAREKAEALAGKQE